MKVKPRLYNTITKMPVIPYTQLKQGVQITGHLTLVGIFGTCTDNISSYPKAKWRAKVKSGNLHLITLTIVILYMLNPLSMAGQEYSLERHFPWQMQPKGIATDTSGNVYLTIGNTVRVYNSDGIYLRKWGEHGSGDGQFIIPSGIVVSKSGYIYVSDTSMLFGDERIQKFSLNGKFLEKWGSIGSNDGQFGFATFLTVDNLGNIYLSDRLNSRIQKFDPDGNFIEKWSVRDPDSNNTPILYGIAVDNAGFVYVVDRSNTCILKFDQDGNFVKKWGDKGSLDGQFIDPWDIIVDKSGFIYVTDVSNSCVQRFNSNGKFISKWDLGPFSQPTGLTLDVFGNIYVIDHGNRCVLKLDLNGKILQEWNNIFGTDKSKLSNLRDIALDNAGNTYIIDYSCLFKFDQSGELIAEWDRNQLGGNNYGSFNGICIDNVGFIYIADSSDNCIGKFDLNGNFIEKWGAEGPGYNEFCRPLDVAIDTLGYVYVIDGNNNSIRKFDSTGNLERKWSTNTSSESESLNSLAIDNLRNIYILSANFLGGGSIQKYDSDGNLLLKWQIDGKPSGIDVDDAGNVYVAGTNIQRFNSEGSLIAKWELYSWYDTSAIPTAPCLTVDAKGNVYVGVIHSKGPWDWNEFSEIQVFRVENRYCERDEQLVKHPTFDNNGRFWIYRENTDLLPFIPCGWMPEESIQMIETFDIGYHDNPYPYYGYGNISHSGNTCIAVGIHLKSPWWCGVAFMTGEKDKQGKPWWGQDASAPVYDLSSAKSLECWLRGFEGGERIQIKVGILGDKPFGDSTRYPVESQWLTLSNYWQRYVISLKGADLSCIANGFTFVVSSGSDISFFIDDIAFVSVEQTPVIYTKCNGGGSINPFDMVCVKTGSNASFTINPDNCSKIEDVSVDGVSVIDDVKIDSNTGAGKYDFINVREDHKIEASFIRNKYTIKIIEAKNGNINPSDSVEVDCGASKEFTITPNSMYQISDVKVDNVSVIKDVKIDQSTGIGKYTFTNVTSNHTIEPTDHTIEVTFVHVEEPNISVSLLEHDFGRTKVGNPSTEIVVSISNIGNADLNVSDMKLSDGVNYSLNVNGGSSPYGSITPRIAPGGICTFTLFFKPLSIGGKSANLKIISNDPDNPELLITLKGSGIGIKGDANDDGSVRSNDAIIALRISASLVTPSDYQKWAADMNEDGYIRSNDAILILRKSVGLTAPGISRIMSGREKVNVRIGTTFGATGQDIWVPLRFGNTTVLSGGDICITYDSIVLHALDVKHNPNVLLVSSLAEPGTIRMAFADTGNSGRDKLCEIGFRVLSDSKTPLKFKSVELYGTDTSLLISESTDGEFRSWSLPPERNDLLQNFPNPFNPETWIPYQLRKGSEVTIRIFSASGDLVRELRPGYKPAGLYVSKDRAAYWDSRNEAGEQVASGVYFYTIQAGEFKAMKKMIVAK